jgi:ribonuclease PH
MVRADGRASDQLRPVRVTPDFFAYAEGSVLIEMGNTRVACGVSVEERVPPFLLGKGQGWITAEYAMLPCATHQRTQREVARGHPSGRTQEIQRLIGRSLRPVVDRKKLGERTLMVDCDVLQADGGTRTAAITGACAALTLALKRMVARGRLTSTPLLTRVAAVSVGMVDGVALLDLAYNEDVRADVDFNVVMTQAGEFVEVQGTAEGRPFARDRLLDLLDLAEQGIMQLFAEQERAIQAARDERRRDGDG